MNECNAAWVGRWMKARNMALAGYITRIIEIETALSYKQIRRVYKGLEDEGHKLKKKSCTMRGGATIIKSIASKIQASLLMQLYYNIAGDAVYRSVDTDALEKAFRIYSAMRNEVTGMTGGRWVPLDITDAWCLAAELRSAEAMIEYCDKCKTSFFTSTNQRSAVSCPFCKQLEKAIAGCVEEEKECA